MRQSRRCAVGRSSSDGDCGDTEWQRGILTITLRIGPIDRGL